MDQSINLLVGHHKPRISAQKEHNWQDQGFIDQSINQLIILLLGHHEPRISHGT